VQVTVEVGAPQLPFWQVSPPVQAFASLQAVPLALSGFEQVPVEGLQLPAEWHWSCAVQVTVTVGEPQVPLWQVSPCVQALPSLHALPFVLVTGGSQTPVTVLHVEALWHWSPLLGQTTAVP
jgi:hypothetical protein